MSDTGINRAPILVLGIGNPLLKDDGIGIELLTRLTEQNRRCCDQVQFVDGGTQGIALLNYVSGRSALILLDAVALGAEPGTLHVMQDEAVLKLGSRSASAHEGNAGELLRTARLLGDLPERLFLIGIEPTTIGTGIELSEQVQAAIPAAIDAANSKIDFVLGRLKDS